MSNVEKAATRRLTLPSLSTNGWLLLSALHTRVSALMPGTGLEGYLYIMLTQWLAKQLARWITRLNPIPSLYGLTYFDSVHSSSDPSYTWLCSYWEHHESFSSTRRVKTWTGKREELSHPSAFMKCETPQSKAAQKRILPSFKPSSRELTTYIWVNRTLFRLCYTTVTSYASGSGKGAVGGTSIPAIEVRCFSQDHTKLLLFLDEVKSKYEQRRPPTVIMRGFSAKSPTLWEYLADRPKRNWRDIIIPDESKDHLMSVVSECIENQNWYGDRGLAWKTGIMLHGPPGCGKTSTVIGLASHFDLPIYILPLTSDTMRDSLATSAIRKIPPRAILLLEDIDAWSRTQARRLDQDEENKGDMPVNGDTAPALPNMAISSKKEAANAMPNTDPNVSLACLLSILDGVEAVDGKILICTTNALDSLDEALIRPGRIDLFVEFKKATQTVAEELFVSFYRPYSKVDAELDDEEKLRGQAKSWATSVDDGEFSLAQLQGMLLNHKKTPSTAGGCGEMGTER